MDGVLRILVWGLTISIAIIAQTEDASGILEVQKVTDKVFVLVGPRGDRSPENLSNNTTYGIVVTSEGVVLIDSGGTYQGARRIHESIRSLAKMPVMIVINTNSQAHTPADVFVWLPREKVMNIRGQSKNSYGQQTRVFTLTPNNTG